MAQVYCAGPLLPPYVRETPWKRDCPREGVCVTVCVLKEEEKHTAVKKNGEGSPRSTKNLFTQLLFIQL